MSRFVIDVISFYRLNTILLCLPKQHRRFMFPFYGFSAFYSFPFHQERTAPAGASVFVVQMGQEQHQITQRHTHHLISL